MYANKKSLNNKSLFIKHHFHIHVHISNLYLSPRTEKRELSRYMWRRDGDEWWKYNRVKKIVQNFTRCVIFQMTCLTLSIFLRLRPKELHILYFHKCFSSSHLFSLPFFLFVNETKHSFLNILLRKRQYIQTTLTFGVMFILFPFIKEYDLTWERISKYNTL